MHQNPLEGWLKHKLLFTNSSSRSVGGLRTHIVKQVPGQYCHSIGHTLRATVLDSTQCMSQKLQTRDPREETSSKSRLRIYKTFTHVMLFTSYLQNTIWTHPLHLSRKLSASKGKTIQNNKQLPASLDSTVPSVTGYPSTISSPLTPNIKSSLLFFLAASYHVF